ncbi:DNA repair protein RadA [Halosquirtibacter xylanolyticus]|uniref:DNA repair protein RadA n=1 Tax=Halosquirtibacter xylanolyticus TaxID=3374599 RepID=UPI0037499056|nr:DNA repair protein RadA [Prolixibacteraceae bacterium]
MAKVKHTFVCQSCGVTSPKWIGRCNSCGEWNTFVEEVVSTKSKTSVIPVASIGHIEARPFKLSEISIRESDRLDTCNGELNRVLGGGFVPGGITLLGGEPGIGKSTLVLQVALSLKNKKVLYVSGEESLQQLKLRAMRLGYEDDNCIFLSETSMEKILLHVDREKPDFLIIDSIQTVVTEMLETAAGSVGQIRECANLILKTVKPMQVPTLLIGHINKEGSLAGPKVLEHIVDTVLQFEGDRNHLFRILRSSKNRFGSTSELGIFEMEQTGLREVINPSELLLSNHDIQLSGTSISCIQDGMRSFMIEVQALVSSAAYGTPQRSSTGFDIRRLNMLLAVLEKRAGFRLMAKDVFLNIAGGIKIQDPAMDLSVITSVLSSSFDLAIDTRCCFAGEVGLTGEIRPVQRIEQRIIEADKLGFKRIYASVSNPSKLQNLGVSLEIFNVRRIDELVKSLFAG